MSEPEFITSRYKDAASFISDMTHSHFTGLRQIGCLIARPYTVAALAWPRASSLLFTQIVVTATIFPPERRWITLRTAPLSATLVKDSG